MLGLLRGNTGLALKAHQSGLAGLVDHGRTFQLVDLLDGQAFLLAEVGIQVVVYPGRSLQASQPGFWLEHRSRLIRLCGLEALVPRQEMLQFDGKAFTNDLGV